MNKKASEIVEADFVEAVMFTLKAERQNGVLITVQQTTKAIRFATFKNELYRYLLNAGLSTEQKELVNVELFDSTQSYTSSRQK